MAALRGHLEAAAAHGREQSALGRVSTQIPALGDVLPTKFGMSVALLDGLVLSTGHSSEPYSIQSISKLFALSALLEQDPEAWRHTGWEPSDAGYSSVAELERYQGKPRNPFVNPGALVTTDRLLHATGAATRVVIELIAQQSGDPEVASIAAVAMSEATSDHRNAAIAHVLAAHGKLVHGIEQVLDEYFAQCAIAATVETIAKSTLYLADRSAIRSPLRISTVRQINAVLLTAGMYSAAGDIAHRVGLPAKSGIGGGVVAIMPGVGTISVWSPPLDADGNSAGGIAAIAEFAQLAGWSVF